MTKPGLNKVSIFDTSEFAKKNDLACLKSAIDGLDIDKLKAISVDLSKVSNVVNNEVFK